jgi:uncharacterized protein YgbK (DUF1537 family)
MPRIGCIADDLTGATDVASMLKKAGLQVLLILDIPESDESLPPVDAMVIALKTRTVPVADAVAQSLAAWTWLRSNGATHAYFKYCSTFDSTAHGNIGPVLAALQRAMQPESDTAFTIACPTFPANQRTVYMGQLFVGQQLISDSPMRNHPLTPMTDANLVRVLQRQYPGQVGLVDHLTIQQSEVAISRAFHQGKETGLGVAIVDAISEADLNRIAHAAAELPLISGGSVLAGFWARVLMPHLKGHHPTVNKQNAKPSMIGGGAVLIAGSCSTATRAQIAAWDGDTVAIDPLVSRDPGMLAGQALQTAKAALAAGRPVLFHVSGSPTSVRQVQEHYGVDQAATLVESTCAQIAAATQAMGIRRFIIAGGETSGAVARALGVHLLLVGDDIAPGVPWTLTMDTKPMSLALKSGNFGDVHFFHTALEMSP